MVGRVGEDVFGTALRDGLKKHGVDVGGVAATPGPSGVAVILVEARGENSIVIIPGANGKVGAEDLERLDTALAGADSLLLQLEIPLEMVVSAAQMAHARGLRVILDPAPASLLPGELYTLTDILTPNETECATLAGFPVYDIPSAERAAGIFLKRGVEHVIIKMGAHGAYYHDGAAGELVPGFHVTVADTTAAGDAFNGALAVALGKGLALRDAVRFANAAGALSATRHGAQPSMPALEEVKELLHARVGND
jgi:ribokinase